MKQKKPVKLINRYNNDQVFCDDLSDTLSDKNYIFYKVYTQNNPSRVFLVNKDAFIVDSKFSTRDGN